MKIRFLLTAAAAASAWSAAAQQTIDLYGLVTNAAGSPLAGASVTLRTRNISVLSGSDGVYHLIWRAAVLQDREPAGEKREITVTGSVVRCAAKTGDRISIAFHDIRGRLLWGTTGTGSTPMLAVNLPVCRFGGQTGILNVSAGPERAAFRFVSCEGGIFSVASRHAAGTEQRRPAPSMAAAALGVLPVLDTLVAAGTGFPMNNSVRIYVYNLTDTIDFSLGEPDSSSEARQQVVHRINTYRGTLGLKPLLRNSAQEACVDTQCRMDCIANTAHSAFGRCREGAQNECPGWTGTNAAVARNAILTSCLQMMWDEGPPPAGTPCGSGTLCYQQHGHYINMTNSAYTRVACGFYYGPNRSVWSAQNFWR